MKISWRVLIPIAAVLAVLTALALSLPQMIGPESRAVALKDLPQLYPPQSKALGLVVIETHRVFSAPLY